jgi:hypothetical protein
MDRFTQWYRSHNLEITWFIIGWLVFAGIDALINKNYIFALVDFGLAYLNYRLYRNNV